ncbi:LytTR family DNA-binding domain-containing protein [Tenacibaculum sp. SG-28]|uniref:LytR/AlgR family response regulator transcription factor n=1 Tax=Tenacibaculum sp. SG-28 TaxID=754426 RepID=UPI000CF3E7AD|nr:LytTR family DNA-binding domain-containing protein [Tenacibaculum sp. SG-28]PQJ23573.1 DNA-binding response regulator [Tenacibaculum sp. SG-28]
MHSIIIDDDELARVIIEKYCSKLENVTVLETFTNAIEAIDFIANNKVDLVFLDIHMPELSGFDFIDSLKNPPQIILTTSDKKFALDAFEYPCIADYLVKPIKFPRFMKALAKVVPLHHNSETASQTLEQSDRELYVNIDRRLVKILISEIYLIEAKGDYINIKTETKNHIVHTTMKKVEEKLPHDVFLKIHRSFIINLKQIIDIEDNSVLIKKEVIPVSRSNRPELMKRLNLLN